MRKFLLSLASALLVGQTAFATPTVPELFLTTGTTIPILVIGLPGQVNLSLSNFGGWVINFVGTSNSPTTNNPFGLDLTGTVSCISGACDTHPLDVWLSDTGFTDKNTAFESTYSGRISGGGITEQMAWVGPGNILFQSNGADGFPTQSGGLPIGTVGPFGPATSPLGISFDGSKTGGPPLGPSPYSLTIEDIFSGNLAATTFTTDGQVGAPVVPEPSSLVLLGGALLLCASRLRRRRV